MSGLDFQREMAKWNIQLPIVFITAHGDIPMSVQAMKSGAVEFLTKPFRDQELLDAIRLGIERDRVRCQNAAIIADLRQRFADLTEGEREVMAFVVSGLLNKQIAAELGVSEITVKVRRGHVMRKMHAKSLAELVRMADKLGVPEAEDGGACLAVASSAGTLDNFHLAIGPDDAIRPCNMIWQAEHRIGASFLNEQASPAFSVVSSRPMCTPRPGTAFLERLRQSGPTDIPQYIPPILLSSKPFARLRVFR